MALTYEMEGDVLHVTQTIHSFTDTQTQHWYYDTITWKVSGNGKLGDTCDRPMSEESIAWVREHYLPKLGTSLKLKESVFVDADFLASGFPSVMGEKDHD